MNASNVCSFIGHVPKHESFKPVFVGPTEDVHVTVLLFL